MTSYMFDPPFFTHHLAHFVASASPKYVTPLKVIFYLLMKNVVKMFLGYSNKRFSLRYHLKNLFCKICLIVNCSLYCTICFLIQNKRLKMYLWNGMLCHSLGVNLGGFGIVFIYRRFSRSVQLGGLRSVLDWRSHQGMRQSKLCYSLKIPPLVKERTLVRWSVKWRDH